MYIHKLYARTLTPLLGLAPVLSLLLHTLQLTHLFLFLSLLPTFPPICCIYK